MAPNTMDVVQRRPQKPHSMFMLNSAHFPSSRRLICALPLTDALFAEMSWNTVTGLSNPCITCFLRFDPFFLLGSVLPLDSHDSNTVAVLLLSFILAFPSCLVAFPAPFLAFRDIWLSVLCALTLAIPVPPLSTWLIPSSSRETYFICCFLWEGLPNCPLSLLLPFPFCVSQA